MLFYLLTFLAFTPIIISSTQSISLYRTDEQIQSNFSALASKSSSVKLKVCENDQEITYAIVGNNRSSSVALLTCSVHAHELITSEICTDFVNKIVSQNHSILNQIQFFVFYLPNPMRKKVFDGDFCQRTNQNYIDLNRNFPTGFTVVDSAIETYGGQSPLSQSYSICLDTLASKITPTIYLDIHSGQFNLCYYLNKNEGQDPSLSILQQIKEQFCKNCRISNVYDLNILGQAFIDLKQRHNIKYSNLFEIYGGFNANQDRNENCLTIFNPLTQKQLGYYKQKWVNAIIEYFELIILKQSKQ